MWPHTCSRPQQGHAAPKQMHSSKHASPEHHLADLVCLKATASVRGQLGMHLLESFGEAPKQEPFFDQGVNVGKGLQRICH